MACTTLFTASVVVEAGGGAADPSYRTGGEAAVRGAAVAPHRQVGRRRQGGRGWGRAGVAAGLHRELRGGRNSPDWRESDDLVVGDDVPAADVLPASPELWYNVGWGRGAVVKC